MREKPVVVKRNVLWSSKGCVLHYLCYVE